jgi:hypothetical protein
MGWGKITLSIDAQTAPKITLLDLQKSIEALKYKYAYSLHIHRFATGRPSRYLICTFSYW